MANDQSLIKRKDLGLYAKKVDLNSILRPNLYKWISQPRHPRRIH